MLDADCESLFRSVVIRDFIECPKFPRLGTLAVVHMEEGAAIVFVRDRSGDATVHSSADEDDCQFILHGHSLPVSERKFQIFHASWEEEDDRRLVRRP